MPITGPYHITRTWFLEHEGVPESKYEHAIHLCEPHREPMSETTELIRDEARRQAVHAMFQIVQQVSTVDQAFKAAELACRAINGFVLPRERMEFEAEFKTEVDHWVDLAIALRWRMF